MLLTRECLTARRSRDIVIKKIWGYTVGYRVYLKKNYKPVIRRVSDRPYPFGRGYYRLPVVILCAAAALILGMRSHDPSRVIPANLADHAGPKTTAPVLMDHPGPAVSGMEITTIAIPSPQHPEDIRPFPELEDPAVQGQEETPWSTVVVRKGDNLSLIFDRLELSPRDLHEIMALGGDTAILKRLKPDHELRYQVLEGRLAALEYDISHATVLSVKRHDEGFRAESVAAEIEKRIGEAEGVISHSLYLTARNAGLSDNLIMQLVGIYGWDIDFALDIREGDRFYVIFEEHHKNGAKVDDGPILAAEFINQDKSYRAVRYVHDDGHTDYYSDEGYSMRKAFLRTPVNFTRISSGFSLKRRHPVLNKMRAHKGVDYAAPAGTPVVATGDSTVTFAGNDGGYGKVVILRHGGKYSTLYAHLSGIARGVAAGKRIKQGQTIGYVGMTGLATGPHLHYEFRVNGVHHNPLTVELPKALGIPHEEMARFRTQTLPLLAQLDVITGKTAYSAAPRYVTPALALNDKSDTVHATD